MDTILRSRSNGHHSDEAVTAPDAVAEQMERKLNSDEFIHAFELDLPPVDHATIEQATTEILTAVGEDPNREGLLKTPGRVARMYDELLSGYRTDPAKLINGALFDVEYDDMVIVRNIEFSSLCEHHCCRFWDTSTSLTSPTRK